MWACASEDELVQNNRGEAAGESNKEVELFMGVLQTGLEVLLGPELWLPVEKELEHEEGFSEQAGEAREECALLRG